MMSEQKRSQHLTMVMLVLLLLAGCSSSSMKIGWREYSTRARKRAAYDSFNGTERYAICVREGDHLKLDYKLDIIRGSLQLSLQDPDQQPLWEEVYTQDTKDRLKMTTSREGCYQLLVTGYYTAGRFEIDWSLQR